MSTLSVAVPAYNEESMIGDCLDHLLRQTRPIDEIIVVDNGSTDHTADIVADYAARHPSVRLVHESVPGVAAARNRGFDEATSDVIAKTDADSRPEYTWAASIIGFLDSDTGSDYVAVTGPAVIWDGPLLDFQRRYVAHGFRKHPDGAEFPGGLHGPNYAMRTEAWSRVRNDVVSDPSVWEDLDLGLALRDAGLKKYFHPKIMVTMSGRQLRHSPWANRQYLLGGIRTAKARNNAHLTRMMYLDLPVRVVNFSLMWLFFRPWDHSRQNWLPHRLLTSIEREKQLATER